MAESTPAERLRAVLRAIEPASALRRSWRLTGGTSAEVTALEVERASGEVARLVVRRYGDADLRRNPRVASVEYQALRVAREHGVPAPTPYAVDETRRVLPSPYVVVEYVDGEVVTNPSVIPGYLRQLAATLARIHGARDATALAALPRLGWDPGERPTALDASLGEGRIRAALERAGRPPRHNEESLLHGDYWPGNVLWRDERIAAVIDWEDAAVGDPLADVANCRLEILWAAGVEAMDEFTSWYRSMTDVDARALAYWDLRAALKPCGKLSTWGLDAATEATMREWHGWFVDRAIERLLG